MTILPAAYLGSVAYFARLLRDECVIDLGEHFVKRSERNRARILTSGGVMELTAHVRNADRPRTPMREVRLDYSKRWQHQHWMSLVSGYRGSPYFDHYRERFEPFYRRRFDFLADYDLELTRILLEAFGGTMPRISESYVEAAAGDLDLRPRNSEDPAFSAEPYVQVFSDRLPFAPNLSAADLLFAEGPGAAALSKASLR
ncbi:MAG: WbqC family protein [Alistipes sp.]|nr:WbqC family protein [Alistipes sp.]MDE7069287.1 WbqC family protein [Alistipes sp.]